MTNSNAIIVVGAGIIGTTTAFKLASSGFDVSIFDPTPGRGATFAAAGMLAPEGEIAIEEEQNYRLQLKSLSAWQRIAQEVQNLGLSSFEVHQTGTLLVGWDASDRSLLRQFEQVANSFGALPVVVNRDATPELFEGVSERIHEGLLLSNDAWLDPDAVMAALQEANTRLGVKTFFETVEGISTLSDGVEAKASSFSHRGAVGVLCTGVASLPRGANVAGETTKLRPIRGMTLRVAGLDRSSQPTVRAFVRGRPFYMVSRPGGYCVLGATVEEQSSPHAETGELQRLLRDALDIFPGLEQSHFVEHRVGLRPATSDLQPFFNVLEGARWAWSSGHYRHGVTLAPLAASDAVDFVRSAL